MARQGWLRATSLVGFLVAAQAGQAGAPKRYGATTDAEVACQNAWVDLVPIDGLRFVPVETEDEAAVDVAGMKVTSFRGFDEERFGYSELDFLVKQSIEGERGGWGVREYSIDTLVRTESSRGSRLWRLVGNAEGDSYYGLLHGWALQLSSLLAQATRDPTLPLFQLSTWMTPFGTGDAPLEYHLILDLRSLPPRPMALIHCSHRELHGQGGVEEARSDPREEWGCTWEPVRGDFICDSWVEKPLLWGTRSFRSRFLLQSQQDLPLPEIGEAAPSTLLDFAHRARASAEWRARTVLLPDRGSTRWLAAVKGPKRSRVDLFVSWAEGKNIDLTFSAVLARRGSEPVLTEVDAEGVATWDDDDWTRVAETTVPVPREIETTPLPVLAVTPLVRNRNGLSVLQVVSTVGRGSALYWVGIETLSDDPMLGVLRLATEASEDIGSYGLLRPPCVGSVSLVRSRPLLVLLDVLPGVRNNLIDVPIAGELECQRLTWDSARGFVVERGVEGCPEPRPTRPLAIRSDGSLATTWR
jgi:hypothetical protein